MYSVLVRFMEWSDLVGYLRGGGASLAKKTECGGVQTYFRGVADSLWRCCGFISEVSRHILEVSGLILEASQDPYLKVSGLMLEVSRT